MSKNTLKKRIGRKMRHKRVRGKIYGTKERPRLCVFRSANHICAQIINDEQGKTIVSLDDRNIKKGKKIERAAKVGASIAEKAKEKKIKEVVFDRGGYKYHGRVKALAEKAREQGLIF